MADVEIRGLVKRFGDATVVDQLDLAVADGEFVTLLGPSGCGKTTMLRCLAGLEHATAGEISIGGTLMNAPARGVFVPPEKRGTGVVFQSYALWPHKTVHGNVAYPLKLAKLPRKKVDERVADMLASVGLADRGDDYAAKLSGGQQQRVALARAMANRPQLLLFDEPLSNLDAKLRLSMRKEIRRIHRQNGTTAVYVTHDQEEAMALADRIVVLDGGVVQQIGTPEEVYNRPANRFVADFMGFENIIDGTVGESTAEGYTFRAPGFTFEVSGVPPGPAGAAAVAGLRASQLRLAGGGDGGDGGGDGAGRGRPGTFTATVVTTSYLGAYTEIDARVGELRVVARLSENGRHRRGGHIPRRGEEITLSIDPDRAVSLSGAAPREPAPA